LLDNPALYIETSLATYQRAGELSWRNRAINLLGFAKHLKQPAKCMAR